VKLKPVLRISVAVLSLAALGITLSAAEEQRRPAVNSSVTPSLLNVALNSSDGFEPQEPWGPTFAIKGGDQHAARSLFNGDISVELYESKDELIKLVKQPYDEFVYVVRGEAVLTPQGGKSMRFKVGDFFIVPKGFTGTWETLHDYRELIVIETTSVARAEKYYFKGLPDPERGVGRKQ